MVATEEHFRGKPACVVELFQRFMAAVEACGPVKVESVPKGLVLHGSRRIFASVRLTAKGLQGHLNLPSQVEDPRFPKVEQLTSRLYFHRFILAPAAELDEAFIGWIRQAYDVGEGRPIASTHREAAEASSSDDR